MKLFSTYYNEQDPFGIFDSVETNAGKLNQCDAIILWGGADIAPSIYGEPNYHSHASLNLSMRDHIEIQTANAARKAGIPIIGVCRGAQLMCALEGGTLFQHIKSSNHHKPHLVKTYDDKFLTTSSCHHQALNVEQTEHEILATESGTSTVFVNKTETKELHVPEVVYFPKMKGLAIQGHPEWMNVNTDFVQWCKKEIQERLL